jgi:hypothetical protein
MLWTVAVVFVCREHHVYDQVVHDEAKQVGPAMLSDDGTHRATVMAVLRRVLVEGSMCCDNFELPSGVIEKIREHEQNTGVFQN